eukprot:m51a1_g10140 hypothetical protein (173) ;mRNA; r:52150-53038
MGAIKVDLPEELGSTRSEQCAASCSGCAQQASLAIPETMRALVFQEKGRIELVSKPVPRPGPTDALLKITCTTICGTDVHILKVGIIVAVGSAVTTVRVGGRYVVGALTPCGHCCSCQEGHAAQCGGTPFGGWKFGNRMDGSQAEYLLVPNADYNCCPIPDEIPDAEWRRLT